MVLTDCSVFESWPLFTDLSNRMTTFGRVRNKWRLNFVSRRGKNLRITPWTYFATCQPCLPLKRPTSVISRHDIAFVKPGCHIKGLQKMPKTQKISSFTLYITRYSHSVNADLFETRFYYNINTRYLTCSPLIAAKDKAKFNLKLWPGYEKRFLSHLHYFAVKKEVFISFSSQCKLTNKTQISLCVPSVHKQVMSQTTLRPQNGC